MSVLRARPGSEHLRVTTWRGNPDIAQVAVVGGVPSADTVRRYVRQLADEGYRTALTAALAPAEQAPFLSEGFEVHDRLHLLVHDLTVVPRGPRHRLRRARRSDRDAVLEVDVAAFPAFWQLDGPALQDALDATPATRFRVVPAAGPITGYAISGRAGTRGYLQRLAVHPRAQRAGIGSALVLDALRWARRHRATELLVNTQVGNHGAIAAYERLGFARRPDGLAVLRRQL